MSAAPHFFVEEVGLVEGSSNVGDGDLVNGDGFADKVVAEVEVRHSLYGSGLGPLNAGMVIILNGDGAGGIEGIEVGEKLADLEGIFDALVGSAYLCLARSEAGAVLLDRLPEDRAAATQDDVSAHGVDLNISISVLATAAPSSWNPQQASAWAKRW